MSGLTRVFATLEAALAVTPARGCGRIAAAGAACTARPLVVDVFAGSHVPSQQVRGLASGAAGRGEAVIDMNDLEDDFDDDFEGIVCLF